MVSFYSSQVFLVSFNLDILCLLESGVDKKMFKIQFTVSLQSWMNLTFTKKNLGLDDWQKRAWRWVNDAKRQCRICSWRPSSLLNPTHPGKGGMDSNVVMVPRRLNPPPPSPSSCHHKKDDGREGHTIPASTPTVTEHPGGPAPSTGGRLLSWG